MQLPRWLLPAALCGVLAIAITDVVMLRRRPAPPPAAQKVSERIGLTAEGDGEALHLQWDRHARPVHSADRGVLYILDGGRQSQLDLTSQQLNSASVRYWPESPAVKFRMEVYNGAISTSESVQVPVGKPVARPATARAVLVKNPSPFERVRPEIVRREVPRPVPVVERVQELRPEPEVREHESGISRVVSKIPLLRRLKRHRQSDSSAPPAENEPRP
jgi:hypothetical protein